MRYYKTLSGGFLVAIGHGGNGGVEITEAEYNRIKTIIDSRPTAPDGFAYRLTENLEWELYEVPVVEPVEELTEIEQKARAYDILMGVAE